MIIAKLLRCLWKYVHRVYLYSHYTDVRLNEGVETFRTAITKIADEVIRPALASTSFVDVRRPVILEATLTVPRHGPKRSIVEITADWTNFKDMTMA